MSDEEQTAIACFLWAAGLIVLLVLLSGCASTFTGICGVAPLGQNESGVAFLRVRCEAME